MYSGMGIYQCIRKERQRGVSPQTPLLTVETEVYGDSKSTNEKGPSMVIDSLSKENFVQPCLL
jgi:hypothetical protein